jgi:hypothetical protein
MYLNMTIVYECYIIPKLSLIYLRKQAYTVFMSEIFRKIENKTSATWHGQQQ